MSTELFVGNLAPDTHAGDLEGAFAPWGCRDAAVAQAERRGPEHYGFVTVDASAMNAAVEAMNGAELLRQRLTVYPASCRDAPEGLGDQPYPTRSGAAESSD